MHPTQKADAPLIVESPDISIKLASFAIKETSFAYQGKRGFSFCDRQIPAKWYNETSIRGQERFVFILSEGKRLMNKKDEGLEYLKIYPNLKKWITTCIICGSIGYNPELPEVLSRSNRTGEHWTVAAQNIRKYFQPLQVNDLSICDVCQKICCTDVSNAGQNNR